MPRILLVLVFGLLALLPLAAQSPVQPPVCAGTKDECQQQEILQLRQQVLALQTQVVNAQIQQAQFDLQRQQVKLIADVAERLHAKIEDIDPVTLTVKPTPAPVDAGPQLPLVKERP